jgi:hypothetical protein
MGYVAGWWVDLVLAKLAAGAWLLVVIAALYGVEAAGVAVGPDGELAVGGVAWLGMIVAWAAVLVARRRARARVRVRTEG